MARGLPVVTSRLAGAAPAIDAGRTGLLLNDQRSVDEIAGALQVLLDDSTRARIGEVAAASVDAYRWDRVIDRADRIIFGS